MGGARFAAAGALAAAAVLIATVGAAASTERGSATTTVRAGAKLSTPQGGKARHAARTSTSSSFECSPTPTTTPINTATEQTCVVTGPNARCVEKSSSPVVVQSCTITQTDPNNGAFVLQDISTGAALVSGSTYSQDSTQKTSVTQQGTTNSLDATQDVNQSLNQSTITALTQKQDDHQNITVCQGAASDCSVANSGGNTSKIHQSRFASEHASGGTITQNQDTTTGTFDCVRNLCALVQQNSTASNNSDLNQEDHLQQVASGTLGANVTQKQQQLSDGIQGDVPQTTNAAQNSSVVHQHMTDDMSAPDGASQSQDPELDCCSPQGGNPESNSKVHQVATLRASQNDAFQHVHIQGNTESNGSCTILQVGKINIDNFTTRDSEQASTPCSAFISCTSQQIEYTPAGCQGFPPKGKIEEVDLTSLGFDTLDFTSALNFVFPLSLPLSPV